jgi:hypothetical protein
LQRISAVELVQQFDKQINVELAILYPMMISFEFEHKLKPCWKR